MITCTKCDEPAIYGGSLCREHWTAERDKAAAMLDEVITALREILAKPVTTARLRRRCVAQIKQTYRSKERLLGRLSPEDEAALKELG